MLSWNNSWLRHGCLQQKQDRDRHGDQVGDVDADCGDCHPFDRNHVCFVVLIVVKHLEQRRAEGDYNRYQRKVKLWRHHTLPSADDIIPADLLVSKYVRMLD